MCSWQSDEEGLPQTWDLGNNEVCDWTYTSITSYYKNNLNWPKCWLDCCSLTRFGAMVCEYLYRNAFIVNWIMRVCHPVKWFLPFCFLTVSKYNANVVLALRGPGVAYKPNSRLEALSTSPQIEIPISSSNFRWPSPPHSSFGPADHNPFPCWFLEPPLRAFAAALSFACKYRAKKRLSL